MVLLNEDLKLFNGPANPFSVVSWKKDTGGSLPGCYCLSVWCHGKNTVAWWYLQGFFSHERYTNVYCTLHVNLVPVNSNRWNQYMRFKYASNCFVRFFFFLSEKRFAEMIAWRNQQSKEGRGRIRVRKKRKWDQRHLCLEVLTRLHGLAVRLVIAVCDSHTDGTIDVSRYKCKDNPPNVSYWGRIFGLSQNNKKKWHVI